MHDRYSPFISHTWNAAVLAGFRSEIFHILTPTQTVTAHRQPRCAPPQHKGWNCTHPKGVASQLFAETVPNNKHLPTSNFGTAMQHSESRAEPRGAWQGVVTRRAPSFVLLYENDYK